MINIQLTPHLEELVRDQVASGRFRDANAVVEEALLLLEDEQRVEDLRRALKVGEDDIAAGNVDRFTPELFAQLRSDARRMVREGYEPDPDVRP